MWLLSLLLIVACGVIAIGIAAAGMNDDDARTTVLLMTTNRMRRAGIAAIRVTARHYRHITSTAVTGRIAQPGARYGQLAMTIAQRWCRFRGHTSVLHYEADRMQLRCTSCGYDSPGWSITPKLIRGTSTETTTNQIRAGVHKLTPAPGSTAATA
jgi:hypothetical protein